MAEGLDFLEVMLASAAANLAFAMPVSGLAGLGPPQAAWAATLHLTGVAWSPAIVTALICHGVLLTGAIGLGVATVLVPALQPMLAGCVRVASAAGRRSRRRVRPAST